MTGEPMSDRSIARLIQKYAVLAGARSSRRSPAIRCEQDF